MSVFTGSLTSSLQTLQKPPRGELYRHTADQRPPAMASSLVGVSFFVEGFGSRRKDISAQITRYGGRISFILSKEVRPALTLFILMRAQCKWIVAENPAAISAARLESCRLPASVVLSERQLNELLSRSTLPAAADVPSTSEPTVRAPSVITTAPSVASSNFTSASTQRKLNQAVVPVKTANSRIPADSTPISSATLSPNSASAAPSVTLVLPDSGPCHGGNRIAIFGIGFKPATFRLQIGSHVLASGFEWHCATALVVHLPSLTGVLPGEVLVSASNDAGAHYGMSVKYTFSGAPP